MLSDNQMISQRQASWIFMLNMLGAGLFSLTSVRTQVPSVSLLFSGLLTILVVIFYYMVSFRIFEYYEKKTGLSLSGRKLPAVIILLWLMLYFPGLENLSPIFIIIFQLREQAAYACRSCRECNRFAPLQSYLHAHLERISLPEAGSKLNLLPPSLYLKTLMYTA